MEGSGTFDGDWADLVALARTAIPSGLIRVSITGVTDPAWWPQQGIHIALEGFKRWLNSRWKLNTSAIIQRY
jgi:hypothetical protein